jgi:PAT family beta-lactamase induction signal transducer AmpG
MASGSPRQTTPPANSFGRSLAVYLDPRMIVILLLGFSSGLPYALSFATLSVWLAELGVSKTEIGLFTLVGMPYVWKFVWSPLVDSVRVPLLGGWLGQRRSWALVAQAGLMGALVWLGSLDPAHELKMVAVAAIVVAFMSATQDVVIDAYRIEILREDEQGAGSAMTQYGYRFGMLASGAGALYLSDHVPWSSVYAIEAALLVIGMLTILFAREPATRRPRSAASGTAGVVKEIVVDPFADFVKRPWWALVLAFVVLYRFPDVFLSVMANVFYKDLGFSNSEIASVSKIFGTGATLVGVFVGGLVVHRMGLLKSLFLCGVVQMLSNLMYITMAWRGQDIPTFAATIAVENVSGGMTGVAFVAYLSSLCSPGFAGSQYALLSALGLFTRNTLSAASGWLAESVGWSWFFAVSALVAVPGMLLLTFFVLSGRFDATPVGREAPAGDAG